PPGGLRRQVDRAERPAGVIDHAALDAGAADVHADKKGGPAHQKTPRYSGDRPTTTRAVRLHQTMVVTRPNTSPTTAWAVPRAVGYCRTRARPRRPNSIASGPRRLPNPGTRLKTPQ